MDSSTPPYHRSNPSFLIADKPSQEDPLPITMSNGTITKSPSPSPLKKLKTHLTDRLEIAAEEELAEPPGMRRRCKSRGAQTGAVASPRNARKSRRRSEIEIREEKDVGFVEEVGKHKKRRHNVRSKKEKLNLVHSVQPSTPSPKIEEESRSDVERVGQLMSDLIMWKDVSKSSLWFGFGSSCLLSSCFSQGLNFSIFSAMSQLAILFLGVSFFWKSICRRNQIEEKCEFKLKEDDILRLAKLILPALNLAISKTSALFSGEPSMTLKVVPFLLLGAEYGHFITMWRLCAIGFFVSFSVPKLYSCYTAQINQRAEFLKLWLLDAWFACTHKKKVMASVLMTFWNLSSIKTRIFTAFIMLVLFKYLKQHVSQQLEDGEAQVGEKVPQQPLMVAEPEEKEPKQALMVTEH
ncbi:reticulon-like protein B17 [Gastrolobium bilobum]|uniref:reticulon-like protein B17 n=1 Tax=Gastrolobium bilobum TaxID=150636 RepID=UPI002AB21098|nr:reticulon-like protein B17 [Gastrolobium bilobum]